MPKKSSEGTMNASSMMDWKKSLNAAVIPIVALIVLSIIGIALGFVIGGFLGGLISFVQGLVFFGIAVLITLWAGYNAVKSFKLDLMGAALTGLFAGGIANW